MDISRFSPEFQGVLMLRRARAHGKPIAEILCYNCIGKNAGLAGHGVHGHLSGIAFDKDSEYRCPNCDSLDTVIFLGTGGRHEERIA
jgi:hypothetical protein